MGWLDKLAIGLLKPINPYAQMLVGLFTSVWGLWILMPWEVFGTAPLFSKMNDFAPEWAWGTWAFICGVFITAGVIKGLWKFLSNSLAFAVWHWGTVALMMWFGDWQNTGAITYSFIATWCAYCWLNIRVNYIDVPDF